ncbi:Siderophore iron transporter mirb [Pyrenophora tritici-repentis]|uniref:Siderophore iron transporter mirb n=1 Tax=Pyrenophora tritici-repentis TaxID=45151 RepID=A0A922N666_9PLEO|nr:Siderophore iron transporter mirb [Pyrenophora tritici-repentis]
MASGYVPQMEKMAGMSISEQRVFTSDHVDGDAHAKSSSTDKCPSDITMNTLVDSQASITAVPPVSRDIDPEQPKGPAEMEAVTVVWTQGWLVGAYAAIMLISFINSLQQQANYSWRPYVTSAFQQHGLTAMTDIVANIVGGVSKLPLAKFIDLVGRPQGFLLCLACIVISLLLMALCQNVQTFCAAQVIYWSGMNGVDYVFNIFIADTSLMQNRLIWMAFTGFPYIINTFAGPAVGQAYLDRLNWRWGYITFVILTPLFSLAFWLVFFLMGRRAKKMGVIKREKIGRTVLQSIRFWCIEFDVIGILLICSGFSLVLLCWPLVKYQANGFASALFLCMLIVGLFFIGLFVVWERFFAPKTFFPFHLMKNRSVVAACLLGGNSSYKMMYSSYLQVVFQLSVSKAGYITNIFNIVSCTWAILISFVMKYTDTFKWGGMIAVPVQILMTGLLVYLRAPGTSIALLVMVEVFNAMASAMLLNVEQIAIMLAVPHEEVAVGFALLNVITAVGGAVGQSIGATVWSQVVRSKIEQYLPDTSKGRAKEIYSDITIQLALPWGSPEREAVVMAFADAQKVMLIIGTCALVPCLIWVAMLKDSRMSLGNTRKGLQA